MSGYVSDNYATKEQWEHLPVLPREVVEYMSLPNGTKRFIDGTLGSGGHSKLILEANPEAELLGIDRDEEALERTARRLAFAGDRVKLVHGEFSNLAAIAEANNFVNVDGVLLDIGVSSPQIDDPARGFSWRHDGPLDMRMNMSGGASAADMINTISEMELTKILSEYGEIRSARKLASAIVTRRKGEPFSRTVELANFCEEVLGRTAPGKLPLPTLVFQALRIAVNNELGELESGLNGAMRVLGKGGRLAVISFHSLEDRLVKNFMRDAALSCICPPSFPVCSCNKRSELKVLTRKVVMAQPDELEGNRRSAPARLRVAERI